MGKTILFLYGTLKRGQKNHHFLAGQEFLGEVATMPLYRLYGLGWHPGMVRDPDNGLDVAGELWGRRRCNLSEHGRISKAYRTGSFGRMSPIRDCF